VAGLVGVVVGRKVVVLVGVVVGHKTVALVEVAAGLPVAQGAA